MCGKTFLAKTITSRYCFIQCSRSAYSQKKREGKLEELRREKAAKVPKDQPYLSISDAIALYDVCRDTLYRLVRSKALRSYNFGKRMTRICKEDLERNFNLRPIDEQKHKIQRLENEARNLDFQQKHIERRVKRLSDYLEKINDISEIKKAITSSGHIYESFEGKEYGNIVFLSAMVYYSLLDKTQLQAFIHWAVRNGINKVNEPDDLSKDSAAKLIKMFEQIFQSKKNEVFVSMQFGDSQSELIYEKIVRAIEQFNTKYTGIHLNVYPIRIDRTVESSTYSIQDRILEAIKSCSLIIADLSSKNINVYHEIGYAMGVAQANNLLPNMILLYKEDTEYNEGKQDIDKFVGFNLRNLSQLRFKDYKQLVDGLVERLEKHYEV